MGLSPAQYQLCWNCWMLGRDGSPIIHLEQKQSKGLLRVVGRQRQEGGFRAEVKRLIESNYFKVSLPAGSTLWCGRNSGEALDNSSSKRRSNAPPSPALRTSCMMAYDLSSET